MKVYLIETKTFYVNQSGYEQQVADAGETPMIFTAKYKAEKEFYEQLKNQTGLKERDLRIKVQMFPMTHYEWKQEIAGTTYRRIKYLHEVETY